MFTYSHISYSLFLVVESATESFSDMSNRILANCEGTTDVHSCSSCSSGCKRLTFLNQNMGQSASFSRHEAHRILKHKDRGT